MSPAGARLGEQLANDHAATSRISGSGSPSSSVRPSANDGDPIEPAAHAAVLRTLALLSRRSAASIAAMAAGVLLFASDQVAVSLTSSLASWVTASASALAATSWL